MITRPGRLIVVNSVIRARPTQHLIIEWALDKVDRGCMAFFWDGSDNIHCSKCLVDWNKVCSPKQRGGLGVLNLKNHGIVLRLRLGMATTH